MPESMLVCPARPYLAIRHYKKLGLTGETKSCRFGLATERKSDKFSECSDIEQDTPRATCPQQTHHSNVRLQKGQDI